MDAERFDALSRALATGVSRRQALARLGAGGLAAGLAAAVGLRGRTGAALPGAQADTCRLEIVANVRLGPSAGAILQGTVPGELRGELSFALGAGGAIDTGRWRLEDGTELPVVGQAVGRAINLRARAGDDSVVVLVGTAEQGLERCAGAVDGLLTGPRSGDLGDWQATATPVGGGGAIASGGASGQPARRTATAAATVAATGEATAAATGEATAVPEDCPDGEERCGDDCVDLQTDRNNCGACGEICPDMGGLVCAGGACGCPSGWTECGQGQAIGGYCADLRADDLNCGACGARCEPGSPCEGGVCVTICPDGQTNCGGVCVDLQTDPDHCGACGNACGLIGPTSPGENCVAGACQPQILCAAPLAYCNGACVDVSTDPANCGACGTACAADESCFGGACIPPLQGCVAPEVSCGGVCVDVLSDPENCGACGNACGPLQTTCTLGVCQ